MNRIRFSVFKLLCGLFNNSRSYFLNIMNVGVVNSYIKITEKVINVFFVIYTVVQVLIQGWSQDFWIGTALIYLET